jgi:hypothetical protein
VALYITAVSSGAEGSENAAISLEGNLRIETGGDLTLTGLRLSLGGSYNG